MKSKHIQSEGRNIMTICSGVHNNVSGKTSFDMANIYIPVFIFIICIHVYFIPVYVTPRRGEGGSPILPLPQSDGQPLPNQKFSVLLILILESFGKCTLNFEVCFRTFQFLCHLRCDARTHAWETSFDYHTVPCTLSTQDNKVQLTRAFADVCQLHQLIVLVMLLGRCARQVITSPPTPPHPHPHKKQKDRKILKAKSSEHWRPSSTTFEVSKHIHVDHPQHSRSWKTLRY